MKAIAISPTYILFKRLFILLVAASHATLALATPYASGVINSNQIIYFTLNESADSVTVVFDSAISTNLGALPKGTHSFSLGSSDTYAITVTKVSGPGYLAGVTNQISADTNILMRFVNQRGVSVNKNPASPYFGRVYVSVSQIGTNAASGRVLSDGIYVLNADQTSALGQGNNGLTGGINFTNPPSNAESPHRVTVGADDNLYIADWSDTSGSVYVTDPNVASGTNVLGGPTGSQFPILTNSGKIHGSIPAVYTEGSLAKSNLTVWVIDEDLQTNRDSTNKTELNSLWRWSIGSKPLPATNPPVKVGSGPLIAFASQLADFTRGPDGKWYFLQRRANAGTTGLFVRSSDNLTTLWNSLTESRKLLNNTNAADLLLEISAVDISPDGKYLAVLKRDDNSIIILPLTGGVPNITNRIVMPVSATTPSGRDLAFDAAGNLYSVSDGQGLLRIYSPGGTTVATTFWNGNFTVSSPPLLTVKATSPVTAEGGPNPGVFAISRSGDTNSAFAVRVSLTGTAINGFDYQEIDLPLTLPAGATNLNVLISPIDDLESELMESVIITLLPSTDYTIGQSSTATLFILDNDTPMLRVSAVDTNMYERVAADTGSFQVTRLGNTNVDVFLNFNFDGGTAVKDVDFSLVTDPSYIPPGVVNFLITVAPIDNANYQGDKTVVFTLLPDPGYLIDGASSAAIRLQEDELLPAAVLFSDDFDLNTSANWLVRFGANNGILDLTTNWAFEYSTLGIPPAPHSIGGTTKGLQVMVNKNDNSLSSAGVNLYPAGQSFGGDFALRFDMYISVGSSNITEHALAGINHSGLLTNRVRQSSGVPDATTTDAAGGDGIWFAIDGSGGNLRDYAAYTTTNQASVPTTLATRSASTLSSLFSSPPWFFSPTAQSSGSPGNAYNSTSKTWADCEISQLGKIVTFTLNRNVILQITNITAFTNGNVMLGQNDQFDSKGASNNFVIFDNVRVVSLSPQITNIQLLPDNSVQIDFTSPRPGLLSEFHLQSAGDFPAAWSTDATAQISAFGAGFRAVTTLNGATRFYQISRD